MQLLLSHLHSNHLPIQDKDRLIKNALNQDVVHLLNKTKSLEEIKEINMMTLEEEEEEEEKNEEEEEGDIRLLMFAE